MNTLFMNSENSKMSDPHRLSLNLADKTDLRWKDKYIALLNLSIYYTWKNIKTSYQNNKFKIPAPTWNEEFELPDASYSVSDIQDYFEHTLKNCGEKTDNLWIRMYVNKIENIITFKIKTRYYIKLLVPETMTLLGNTKKKITKGRKW